MRPSLRVSRSRVHFQLPMSLYFLMHHEGVGSASIRFPEARVNSGPVFAVDGSLDDITLVINIEHEDDRLQPQANHVACELHATIADEENNLAPSLPTPRPVLHPPTTRRYPTEFD